MKTLFKNATIIPMTEDKYHFVGDMLIEDDKIIKIAQSINDTADHTINCEGKIILPAFVNCHTHLAMTLMRNYKDDTLDLFSWLSQIWPIEDKLVDEDIYHASILGLGEMIKSGCTTFADMYFNTWETARACTETGMRGIIGLTFFGDENESRRRIKELVPRLEDAIGENNNLRIDAAVHAIYTCSPGTYSLCKEWAEDRGTYFNTHLSETKKEVEDSIKEFGLTPARLLDSLGVLNERTYLAHGVWLDEEEQDIISRRGSSIIHNPSSNCKLASGVAPVAAYKSKGINVALGTDGASSNNNLNLLKEMNLASMLSSVSTLTPSILSPYDIIKMATKDGAKALGLDNKIGSLESGKEADFIVLDMNKLNTTPTNNPFSAIVFSLDRSNIEYVYSSGKALLDKGLLTTIDEDKAIRNTYRQWNDILNR